MTINCRNCINWIDETLQQVELDAGKHRHIFMGCRIFGYVDKNESLESCAQYTESQNLFAICCTCKIAVPKVCVSLGECCNCTDTDLFCVDHCKGGDNRKYCTHFVRLRMQGIQLIDQNDVFDLFPIVEMPGTQRKSSPASENGYGIPKNKAHSKE